MAYPTLKNLKWNYIITDKENIGLAKKFNRFFFVFFFTSHNCMEKPKQSFWSTQYKLLPLYNCKGFDLGHTWTV